MKNILFVDDSLTYTAVMSEALKTGGFEVVTASKGAEVMPIAEGGKLDMIILDMILPDITGIDLLRRLKSNARTKRVPVIVLTGRENQAEAEEVMRNGAHSHMVKSRTTPELLLEQMRSFLK
jgi:CheY-like chemotaxis protein